MQSSKGSSTQSQSPSASPFAFSLNLKGCFILVYIFPILSTVKAEQNNQYINYQVMTPEEHVKFKQSLKETQERSQQVVLKGVQMIDRIDKTIEGVRDTISQIQENQRNIDNFKSKFGDVMNKLAQKLSGAWGGNPLKKIEGKEYEHLPTTRPVAEVVKSMLGHKQILFITGAGVSAASGIPTFRGQNGLYSKKFEWEGKQYQPEEFITKAFFDKHPQAIWQWVDEIYKMSTEFKPNSIHILIDTLAKVIHALGKKVTLVTQNIDDLHLKPDKEYEYYPCHGNVKQIRCENNHLHNYKDHRESIIDGQQEVKCPQCELPLRPHVLFFDEAYGELYGGEARDKEYPFVFVIGSSLSTGLCTKLTAKALQVVEINPSPQIQVGLVYRFTEDTVAVLESFLKEMGESE